MNKTCIIRTDREVEIDAWMGALWPDKQAQWPKMTAITESALRLMGRSDIAYTLTDLWQLFADSMYRRAFIRAESRSDDSRDEIALLIGGDDALFSSLARRLRWHIEGSPSAPGGEQ